MDEPTLFDPPTRILARVELCHDGTWSVRIDKWTQTEQWRRPEIYTELSLSECASAVESAMLSL